MDRTEKSASAGSDFPPLHLTLRDGRSVTIREVRPDDADAYRAALEGLSAASLHSRFFSAVRPNEALVERAVRADAERERALVAVAGGAGPETIVGGGRCITEGDRESCEFAVMIADGWHGQGLASNIMRALIKDARKRGLKRMEGQVLAENRSMLDLARRLGFEIGASDEGPSVKLVTLDLARARDMQRPEPFIRETGSGPGVVCIHSNASSSAQWRGLMELLAPKFHVFAPDSYGSGKSPEWPSDRVIALRDEVAFMEPVLAKAGAPLALVGHSYGAAVALIAALDNPGRVRALALYEPTLFSLIEAEKPAPNDADGIQNAVARSSAALDAGDQDAAARHFIDYWMGEGAWQHTPEQRKPPIAASVTNVRRWAHALTTEPAPLAAFRTLDIPVLYMVGRRSTASAHGVARLLTKALPRVEVLEFEKLGHMGPVTHPEPVNQAIVQFLDRN